MNQWVDLLYCSHSCVGFLKTNLISCSFSMDKFLTVIETNTHLKSCQMTKRTLHWQQSLLFISSWQMQMIACHSGLLFLAPAVVVNCILFTQFSRWYTNIVRVKCHIFVLQCPVPPHTELEGLQFIHLQAYMSQLLGKSWVRSKEQLWKPSWNIYYVWL